MLYHDKYEQIEFEFLGRYATVIKPKIAKKGNPFIFRAEFLGAFDYCDVEMLERGYHLAYVNVKDMYGCPESVEILHKFHLYLIENFSFSKKTTMFGFSRGGLYTFNYATTYPEYVACVYLDAPVLDLASWPAGIYRNAPYVREWEQCKEIYSINEQTVVGSKLSPINRLKSLTVPVYLVAGLKDDVVPFEENSEKLIKEYKGNLQYVLKPDCGHHPHGLEDSTEIANFIEERFREEGYEV